MKIAKRTGAALLLLLLLACSIFYYDPLWVRDQVIRYTLWRHGVHSRYISVRGYRIHYLEASPPDGSRGTTLLLVHGLGDRGEAWAPLIPSLTAAGYHVYAPDLLGYGRSDKPNIEYSIRMEEQVLMHFVWALRLGDIDPKTNASTFDLAGWSMGGWIAADLALDQPAWINRLVLYDSAGLRFQPTFEPDIFTPHDEAGLRRLMEILSPRPAAMPHFIARAALRKLERNSRVVQSSMDSMESGRDLLDNRLNAIQQPTLIVWGSEDHLLPISTGLEMHREIPNSVMATITGCGHLAPAECTRPVLDATIQFLKANPPMPRGEETLPGTTPPTPQNLPRAPQ